MGNSYHVERTEVCSSGLGRSPDRRIMTSNDHHSKLEDAQENSSAWGKET
jgi:hypothetical protein